MLDPPGPLEMQLARERSDRIKSKFSIKRARSIVIAILFVILGGIAFTYGQPMLAFNSGVISLIFLVRAIDAHGQLQVAELYSTKTLFPRMSLLDREGAPKTTPYPGTRA